MQKSLLRSEGIAQVAQCQGSAYYQNIMSNQNKALIFILCLLSGIISLASRWIANKEVAVIYAIFVASFFLVLTLVMKQKQPTKSYWQLALAFFIFSFVQLLNNTLPPLLGHYILHQAPVPGNPLSSTVSGTLIIQLFETLIAVVPILILTRMSGENLDSIYVRKGRLGKLFLLAVVVFLALYVFTFRVSARHLFPMRGTLTLGHYLALTPTLLLMVLSNGIQEEFLFRGLFLKKFDVFLGPYLSNFLQALIFAIAHVGITYTSSSTIFLFLLVFPLGLLMGKLMRKTDSVITPAIFHAATDIPIYLAFLTYVS